MRKLFWVCVLVLPLGAHPITVDGDPSDWVGVPPAGPDQFGYSAAEAIWTDAVGDDLGDGGDAPNALDDPGPYAYPDTSLFQGTEADILVFRITSDPVDTMLYFLVELAGFSLTWQPMVVVCMDLDHVTGSGEIWIPQNADLQVSPENAWEYAVVLWDNQVRVFDSTWTEVTGNSVAVFDTAHGVIEAGVDVRSFPQIFGGTVYFTVASGLQDFGNFREVDSTASTWQGGGGIGMNGSGDPPYWADPDVYDLCFVASADQANDLNGYSDGSSGGPVAPSVIRPTTVQPVNLAQTVGVRENGEESLPRQISLRVVNNPARGLAHLYFGLPSQAHVDLSVFDASGRRVERLIHRELGPGHYTGIFRGKEGVYFAVLRADSVKRVVKLILIR